MIFTVKFVVLCCAYCNLRRDFGFFCSINHFSEGGVKANHNVMSSPSLAENDSRLLKNSKGNRDGEWIFCRRKEADVALFLQVTRIRKIRKNREANLKGQCPDYAHARASSVFSSKDNRTVKLTRQDFLPDRTADRDLLFIFPSNILDFQRRLSSYIKIWLAA